MAAPTRAVSRKPTEQEINLNLATLFSSELDADEPEQLSALSTAFVNLTLAYVLRRCPKLMDHVVFDYVALEQMLQRFQRDAFGVAEFEEYVTELCKAGAISKEICTELCVRVSNLGLRITSDDPRKTKIAGAFCLWMSTFRPVHIRDHDQTGYGSASLYHFGANLNFFLCTTYLSLFGSIHTLDDEDGPLRLDRIRHDLTYRAVGHSSLEFLFASIFRADPARK